MSDAILIDTDAGVDDMLALFLLYSLTPAASVDVAVTFGNVPRERALRNVALFARLSGRTPRKLLRGAAGPLRGKAMAATDVHGDDGLGGVTHGQYRDAPGDIEAPALATLEGQHARMIAIGPLTDLQALAARGFTAPLFVMGGAFEHSGNMSPYAEFNFFCDPEAAARVFETWPAEVRVVPLDLSHQIILQRAWLRAMSERYAAPVSGFLREAHQHYMNVYGGREGIDGCHPHDALAVFAVFFPDAFEWRRGYVRIVTEGEERARSILTPDDNGCHYVARSVDQKRFFEVLERAFAAAAG
jgi:inosine-uridine nucleoside N-ribohydrolase